MTLSRFLPWTVSATAPSGYEWDPSAIVAGKPLPPFLKRAGQHGECFIAVEVTT